jgi:hypothetical protein
MTLLSLGSETSRTDGVANILTSDGSEGISSLSERFSVKLVRMLERTELERVRMTAGPSLGSKRVVLTVSQTF